MLLQSLCKTKQIYFADQSQDLRREEAATPVGHTGTVNNTRPIPAAARHGMCRWRKMLLPMAVAGLVCGAVTAVAAMPPGVVIGHRIGAVKVGESRAEVTKALGRGTPVRVEGNPFRFYSKAGIYVLYPPNRSLPRRVYVVMTRSARYKTSSGVGVGSSLRQLRRSVHVTCHPSGQSVACYDGARPLTSFLLSKGTKRVTEIGIASMHY